MTKEVTVKIKVVAPPVGISSWRQTHPQVEVLFRPSFQPAESTSHPSLNNMTPRLHPQEFVRQCYSDVFQEALERMTKEVTPSAPCAVKN